MDGLSGIDGWSIRHRWMVFFQYADLYFTVPPKPSRYVESLFSSTSSALKRALPDIESTSAGSEIVSPPPPCVQMRAPSMTPRHALAHLPLAAPLSYLQPQPTPCHRSNIPPLSLCARVRDIAFRPFPWDPHPPPHAHPPTSSLPATADGPRDLARSCRVQAAADPESSHHALGRRSVTTTARTPVLPAFVATHPSIQVRCHDHSDPAASVETGPLSASTPAAFATNEAHQCALSHPIPHPRPGGGSTDLCPGLPAAPESV